MYIERPTNKDLRTISGIIYRIYNTITKKSYIGKTISTFEYRYSALNWWKYPTNIYLERAIKKHGKENFRISILECGIKSFDNLGKLEEYAIDLYDTIIPNGYNYFAGGNSMGHTDQTRRAISEFLSKEYQFFDNKENKIIKIKNLRKFCIENNLSKAQMTRLFFGNRGIKSHKQYSRVGEKIKKINLISPLGKKHEILDNEVVEFCRKHNVKVFGIRMLLRGKLQIYKGWKAPEFKYKRKLFRLTSPTGELFEIKQEDFSKFREKHGIGQNMDKVFSGKRKQYQGWTGERIIVEV